MYNADSLVIYFTEDLLEEPFAFKKEDEYGYITTYRLAVSFDDTDGNWVGDLLIYFKIFG